jgi:hypothetical protein
MRLPNYECAWCGRPTWKRICTWCDIRLGHVILEDQAKDRDHD